MTKTLNRQQNKSTARVCVWEMYQTLQAEESLVVPYCWGLKCVCVCVCACACVCVCVCVCVYGMRVVFGGGCGLGATQGVRVRLITKGLGYQANRLSLYTGQEPFSTLRQRLCKRQ